MTIDEEHRVMGETLQQRNRLRQQLTALRSEAYKIHEILSSVSYILKSPETSKDQSEVLERLPSREKILQVLADYQAGEEELKRLDKTLQDYGL